MQYITPYRISPTDDTLLKSLCGWVQSLLAIILDPLFLLGVQQSLTIKTNGVNVQYFQ